MDKYRYDYKWLYFKISYDKVVLLTYPVKCARGFKRRKRCKQYLCMPIRMSDTDIILYLLNMSGERVIHVTVKYFMQL